MKHELNAVVLAAGYGKRMKSSLPKVLHPLAGLPMIQHSLRAVAGVTSELPVMVVGHGAEQVQAVVGDKARFVLQAQQLGTAHALRMAEPILSTRPGLLLVITGDMPLLTSATFQRLIDFQRANSAPISMLTVIMDDAHGFGRVVRGSDGTVRAVVEEAQASAEILAINELNASVYVFDADWLWRALPDIPLSPKGEYYLTDVVGVAVDRGFKVQALAADDPEEALGINTREHLAEAEAVMRRRINQRWMLAGVSIVDPLTTYIESDVQIGPDTRILPGCSLLGSTQVGSGCQIGPQTIISNSQLGDRCELSASLVENSVLQPGTRLGPYKHLQNNRLLNSVRNQRKVI